MAESPVDPRTPPGGLSELPPISPYAEVDSVASTDYGKLTAALQKYYANKPAQVISGILRQMVFNVRQIWRSTGILYRWRLNHNLYYARNGAYLWDENIQQDGEQGNSVYLPVNVMRNALKHILTMVNTDRPAVEPVAKNTDQASLETTIVAKAIAESKLHTEKLLKQIDGLVEQSAVLGSGFLHGRWDWFKGGVNASGPIEPGQPSKLMQGPDGQTIAQTFKGDADIEALTCDSVFFDPTVQEWDKLDDMIVRSSGNRYSLMVQYPSMVDRLSRAVSRTPTQLDENLPNPSMRASIGIRTPSQESKIEVWYYYHRKTPALPEGRMIVMLPDGTVLEDGPLPWSEIPVYRMCPDEIMGTAHGYAVVTSVGGLQEALSMGASAMITNMAAFARKIIVAAKGLEVEPSDLTGDLKLLEIDFVNGRPQVEALDLLGDQSNVVKPLEWIIGQIEQITGANSIIRGSPQGVTAGVAINLYEAMAKQFSSPMEKARAAAIEWAATFIVRAYQLHPDIERDVQVVGKSKRPLLRSFYGRDLAEIDRFNVQPSNPMTQTVSGRLQLWNAIKQDGVPIAPERVLQLLQKGSWDEVSEPTIAEANFIEAENEKLIDGEQCVVLPGDNHVSHIREHLRLQFNPEIRFDPAKLQALNVHMQMHLNFIIDGDVILRAANGLLPMGPFAPPGAPLHHGETPPPPQPQLPMPGAAPGGPPGQGAPSKGAPPGPSGPPAGAHPPMVPKPQPLQRLPPVGG